MRHDEDNLQMACVGWADMWFSINYPNLCIRQFSKNGISRVFAPLIHVANERATTPQAGVRLKRKGVRAGFPDIYMPVFCGDKSGLFVELKTPTGRITDNQKEWGRHFKKSPNCFYAICRTLEDFQTAVINYMGAA